MQLLLSTYIVLHFYQKYKKMLNGFGINEGQTAREATYVQLHIIHGDTKHTVCNV